MELRYLTLQEYHHRISTIIASRHKEETCNLLHTPCIGGLVVWELVLDVVVGVDVGMLFQTIVVFCVRLTRRCLACFFVLCR